MHKILLTGSGGTIGTILSNGLKQQITGYDLPDQDVGDYRQLVNAAKGHDTIIHLAWDKTCDDWLTEDMDPKNVKNSHVVFEAAVHAGVTRVIMASSVHADKFAGRNIEGMLRPYNLPIPDSPYGASKCMMEAMGRYYADSKDLEVICIRFGGLNKADTAPDHPYSERQVWLSQRDAVGLIDACIAADQVPGNFAIVNAVSNNKDRLHDFTNPFGWVPKDGTTS